MTGLKQSIVSLEAADSVAGATAGFQDIAGVSTTEKSLDLSALKGRYVKIYSEGVDVYIAFTDVATNVILAASVSTMNDMVPDRIDQGGGGVHVVIPMRSPILKYKAVTGTGGNLRVIAS